MRISDWSSDVCSSDLYGASWKQVSPNRDLMHRPWYYTHVFACPKHADTVYVTNFQMWKSTDGGTQFKEITTPHGDNHRSEERRVGKECVRTFRSRWSPDHQKKNKNKKTKKKTT